MKIIKQILKWYLIGITSSIFILIMLILTARLSNPFDTLNEYHNIPQIIFGFGAFFGLVAFAAFGQPQDKE
jgi:hypothetical protein